MDSEVPEEKEDTSHIDIEKLRLQADKIKKDHEAKIKSHQETVRHNKVTEEQKDKEITIKRNKPTSSK